MGRNNADLHGVNFTHRRSQYGDAYIDATHPELGYLGHMELDPDGVAVRVSVGLKHQRKGVATGMWNYAKQQGLNPKHSESRTKDGDAWAASTGDPVPENNNIYNTDERLRGLGVDNLIEVHN